MQLKVLDTRFGRAAKITFLYKIKENIEYRRLHKDDYIKQT